MLLKFVDDIKHLLNFDDLYYETENEFCFDCRINKSYKFDRRLLDELKVLGILIAEGKRYTKVQRYKDKTYRWIVINKRKFKSLERLVLIGAKRDGKSI